jgi:hypothetical protein
MNLDITGDLRMKVALAIVRKAQKKIGWQKKNRTCILIFRNLSLSYFGGVGIIGKDKWL